jgi:UDP-N-acetylmuramate--alanine ligase
MNFSPLKSHIKHLHFIGIGGAGMSGIAEVLLREGYHVTGSDLSIHEVTRRLEKLGATVFSTHHADNIKGAEVVVISSAIDSHNPELLAAKMAGLPIIPRAQMLAELMRFRYGIAIAGTHGKTTTTSLVTSIFAQANLDPTFVIGGLLNSAGTHANLGQGRYLIAEADESDGSFLHLNPIMLVVTNINKDHLSHYNNDFNQLQETFLEFIHRLPFYGLAVLCLDDPVIEALLPRVARPHVTYGFHQDADFRATDLLQEGMQMRFVLHTKKHPPYEMQLNMPGKHNVLNALAALAIAQANGIDLASVAKTLSSFQGVGRRLQNHGTCYLDAGKKIDLFDDYGHHPREIAVTIEAIRAAYPGRRLTMVFQPHRYTRTKELFDEFVTILSTVDELILLPIYAAGESAVGAPRSEDLHAQIMQSLKSHSHVSSVSELPKCLSLILQDKDLLLMQGAGSIGKLIEQLDSLQGDFCQLESLVCE